MKRILIGSTLVALCAAVAAAQTPKSSPAPTPGTITMPPVLPRTTPPVAKKQTTPTTTAPAVPGFVRTIPTQNLAMAGGTRVDAVFDSRANGFKAALKDGTYKLDNGGSIRVRGGKIVWDAFGVIQRLNAAPRTGTSVAEFPPALG